jgi:1-deoxy-D-xylulose 5-phosphate reductoisomerase
LPFPAIPAVIEATLSSHEPRQVDSLETLLDADARARTTARQQVEARC